MKKILFVFTIVFFSGCTSHMYLAKTTFKDGDQTCMAQAHWYKTEYLFGVKADGVITVLSGGGRLSVPYKEQNNTLEFRGHQGRDQLVIGTQPASAEFRCGWIENVSNIKAFNDDKLIVYMHCVPKTDAFSRNKGYLPARETPYNFTVTEETLWSLFGKLPEAPRPPVCH